MLESKMEWSPFSHCLRNSPMSQVLFGHMTRWTKESTSFTNRTSEAADIAVSLLSSDVHGSQLSSRPEKSDFHLLLYGFVSMFLEYTVTFL